MVEVVINGLVCFDMPVYVKRHQMAAFLRPPALTNNVTNAAITHRHHIFRHIPTGTSTQKRPIPTSPLHLGSWRTIVLGQ